MCLLHASDDAAILFSYTNDETEDADEEIDKIEGGFWDGTSSPITVVRTTEYSYTTENRVVEFPACLAGPPSPPCPTDTTDVLTTVTQKLGTEQAWQESYEYTNIAYKTDPQDPDVNIEVGFFELGVTGEVTTTPYLLRKIFWGVGAGRQFSGGHQYQADATGATDERPGAFEVAAISALNGSVATVDYLNMSTETAPSCAYDVDIDEGHLVNITGTTSSGGVCGHGGGGASSGAFERSGAPLDAKTFENGVRAEYSYDGSRRTTNATANAQVGGSTTAFDANDQLIIGVTNDFFPAGTLASDRLVGTPQLAPRAVVLDYSSVCSPTIGGTWETSTSCGTANSVYSFAPDGNAGLMVGTYSDYDTDYDVDFNQSPGGRITQSVQAGWTLTSLPSGSMLAADHVLYETQYLYESGSTDRLQSITDPLGARTCIIYGFDHRPSAIRYLPASAVQACSVTGQSEITLSTISSYNGDGQPLVSVDERSVTTTVVYGKSGRPQKRTLSYGSESRTWSYTYHPDGSTASVFVGDDVTPGGGGGVAVGYESEQSGPPTADLCGVGVPDEECATGLGWLARVTAIEEGVRTSDTSFTEHKRSSFTFGTSGQSELVEVFDQLSPTIPRRKAGTSYDYRYRPATTERYATVTTHHDTLLSYDSQGALTDVVSPRYDGDSPPEPNATNAYVNGLPSAASVGRKGGATEDSTISYKYDAHGNLARVTDELGRATHYVTDDFGRVIAEDSPERGIIYTVYNALGQAVEQQLGDGSTKSYAYDSRHRLSGSTTTSITSTQCGTETREFLPDGNLLKGRLSEVRHLAGVTLFEYNAFGEVTAVHEAPSVDAVHGGSGGPDICSWRTVRYTYDVLRPIH